MDNNNQIAIAGTDLVFDAVICPHGCRVWPPTAMAMHEEAHKRIVDEYYGKRGRFGYAVAADHKQMGNRHGRKRLANSERKQPVGINIPLNGSGAKRK